MLQPVPSYNSPHTHVLCPPWCKVMMIPRSSLFPWTNQDDLFFPSRPDFDGLVPYSQDVSQTLLDRAVCYCWMMMGFLSRGVTLQSRWKGWGWERLTGRNCDNVVVRPWWRIVVCLSRFCQLLFCGERKSDCVFYKREMKGNGFILRVFLGVEKMSDKGGTKDLHFRVRSWRHHFKTTYFSVLFYQSSTFSSFYESNRNVDTFTVLNEEDWNSPEEGKQRSQSRESNWSFICRLAR